MLFDSALHLVLPQLKKKKKRKKKAAIISISNCVLLFKDLF